jgi:hypothetical protein
MTAKENLKNLLLTNTRFSVSHIDDLDDNVKRDEIIEALHIKCGNVSKIQNLIPKLKKDIDTCILWRHDNEIINQY